MSDFFARIGLALQQLASVSTVNDKASILQLCTELQAAEDNTVTVIEDRIRASVEAIEGRVQAVEEAHQQVADVVNSPEASLAFQEAATKIQDQAAAVEAADDASGLTKAAIIADLEEMKVEFDPRALKGDLLTLRNETIATRAAETTTETETKAADPDLKTS